MWGLGVGVWRGGWVVGRPGEGWGWGLGVGVGLWGGREEGWGCGLGVEVGLWGGREEGRGGAGLGPPPQETVGRRKPP